MESPLSKANLAEPHSRAGALGIDTPFRPRAISAYILIRVGLLIHRIALMIMRPDDIDVFTHRMYSRPGLIEHYCSLEYVRQGLTEEEKDLLTGIPPQGSRLLVLGVGGGREAIALAQLGFSVTGVDFVLGMLKRAQENAAALGASVTLRFMNYEYIDTPPESYDAVWLSDEMYSSLPSRARRIDLLKQVWKTLKPGGYFACQYSFFRDRNQPSRLESVAKILAYLTGGFLSYNKGDRIDENIFFTHYFSSEAELRSEFEEGGFRNLRFVVDSDGSLSSAVLKKK